MKKMYLVLIAVVMAVGFSAFSTATAKTDDVITYQDDEDVWYTYPSDPCPVKIVPECFVVTAHGRRQLFYNYDPNDPLFGKP